MNMGGGGGGGDDKKSQVEIWLIKKSVSQGVSDDNA